MKIAIVEDEGITALFLKENIEEIGHTCVGMFDDSKDIFTFLKENTKPDLVLMDIQINGELNGVQTAIEIKKLYPKISIVFLTSFKDSETIKSVKEVAPLGYLIKPIIESDLEAVLMVVESARKYFAEETDVLKIASYTYNKNTTDIYENNKIIHLSQNEKICLDFLIRNKNSYVSPEKFIEKLWQGENNRLASLRELMYRLRKKLPDLNIINSQNVGYILSDS